ncbi:hypothetical protein OOK13_04800 [Streptomyces sp. NBC_00378]|nr:MULTISPECIES: hypothetical protein [unclassified Streptomyces]MCX5107845.1 hypothetical protein [Streptomyces sp. NBC_00378]
MGCSLVGQESGDGSDGVGQAVSSGVVPGEGLEYRYEVERVEPASVDG